MFIFEKKNGRKTLKMRNHFKDSQSEKLQSLLHIHEVNSIQAVACIGFHFREVNLFWSIWQET